MYSNDFEEHPLDSLLDESSSHEFGAPKFSVAGKAGIGSTHDTRLASWSAVDFSRIYVEYHPHLLRHARRYLSNFAQAEEVVQDAFLYLMTSLPEIDSEEGVLRFLKWKVRNLCFDVLRSSESRRELLTSSYPEPVSDASVSEDLERAEDQAVISLALAKLNPRHKEAIILSVLEYKSSEEVAAHMGLSQNAFRQLLFRAKRAFRYALVGEAELRGQSVAEILSVATRKALKDARQNTSKISAILVFAAVSVGFVQLSSFLESGDTNFASSSSVIESATDEGQVPAPVDTVEAVPDRQIAQSSADDVANPIPLRESFQSNQIDSSQETAESNERVNTVVSPDVSGADNDSEENIGQAQLQPNDFRTVLTTDVTSAGIYQGSYAQIFPELFEGESIEVFGGTGISAFLDYRHEDISISTALYQLNISGEVLLAASRNLDIDREVSGGVTTFEVTASDFYLVDESSRVFSESPMASAEAITTLEIDADGNPIRATLFVR